MFWYVVWFSVVLVWSGLVSCFCLFVCWLFCFGLVVCFQKLWVWNSLVSYTLSLLGQWSWLHIQITPFHIQPLNGIWKSATRVYCNFTILVCSLLLFAGSFAATDHKKSDACILQFTDHKTDRMVYLSCQSTPHFSLSCLQ